MRRWRRLGAREPTALAEALRGAFELGGSPLQPPEALKLPSVKLAVAKPATVTF